MPRSSGRVGPARPISELVFDIRDDKTSRQLGSLRPAAVANPSVEVGGSQRLHVILRRPISCLNEALRAEARHEVPCELAVQLNRLEEAASGTGPIEVGITLVEGLLLWSFLWRLPRGARKRPMFAPSAAQRCKLGAENGVRCYPC